MYKSSWVLALAASLGIGASVAPRVASACGGFFCSQTLGVNQAAERIVFAKNTDDTITAVIEIQYAGPADKFSWLLPISSVPQGDQIAVGSTLSFQRLQQATNPQYNLRTVVEGECDEPDPSDFGPGGEVNASAEGGASGDGAPAVTVEASGQVGSFDWAVISLDQALAEPADAAVEWLNDNDYDVPQGAPGLLGPYLMDGMYLLALKLQKGADAGAIRPIVLTYSASRPMIPIKLTAVAANDDMGVLTWVLANDQAVPKNYNALELNEARINWFNPNANYNDVVTAAANEAGGQGFVTEYAQPGSSLDGVVWTEGDEQSWQDYQSGEVFEGVGGQSGQGTGEQVLQAMFRFSQWDGFWEVVRQHVTLPPDVTLADVQDCPECYGDQLEAAPDFVTALERDVIEPAQVVQKLLDQHPYVTRLYSTLSAAEMTVDPLFTYNPDLAPVDNVHAADRIIECSRGYYEFDAPWRIELPQGGVVRGGPDDFGSWPAAFDDQPANRRILRQGETGSGQVLEDHGDAIDADIMTYSSTVKKPLPHQPEIPQGRGPGLNPGGAPVEDGEAGANDPTLVSSGCACRASAGGGSLGLMASALGLAALLRRRRV
jgi:MYXO-CTERM domain-containing protein